MSSDTVGFIGGGNMTRAIVLGMIRDGFETSNVAVAEPDAEQRKALADLMPGVLISESNDAVVARSDYLVLAVKPQILAGVCQDLAAAVRASRPLIISIAAGPRIDDIDAWLGGDNAIVRVMPNQPALVGRGVSGIFANAATSRRQMSTAVTILSAIGPVVAVRSEAEIDAVTAVSGSGPAYFYLLIDMIATTGESLGLDENAARELALETALGAAELAKHSQEPMQTLISRVRSPGGTTAAALDHLENNGVRDLFAAAITAARDRAVQLADNSHQESKLNEQD